MTDQQFKLATIKKEQIESLENLTERMKKVYNNIKTDDFDKDIVLEVIFDLGIAVKQLITIKQQEFKDI